MKTFIQVNDSGLCVPRPTLEAAQSGNGFNLVIETDDQFTPRTINAAWIFVASGLQAPWWMQIDIEPAAIALAERILRQATTKPCTNK